MRVAAKPATGGAAIISVARKPGSSAPAWWRRRPPTSRWRVRSSAARSGSPCSWWQQAHRGIAVRLGLDALGHHAQAERAAGPHHGALRPSLRIVAARQRGHRGAVDLQLAHRLVRQRRPGIAGGEIVDRHLHAEAAQALEGAARPGVFSIAAVCVSSQQQALGRHVVRLQAALEAVGEIVPAELHAGDVHRHAAA